MVPVHQHTQESHEMSTREVKQNRVGQGWMGSWLGNILMAQELDGLPCFISTSYVTAGLSKGTRSRCAMLRWFHAWLYPLHHFLMVEKGHVSKMLCQTRNRCTCSPEKIVALCWIIKILCYRPQWNYNQRGTHIWWWDGWTRFIPWRWASGTIQFCCGEKWNCGM